MANELKNRIEAVLFSTGKRTEVSLLKNLCDADSEEEVIQQLKILSGEIKERESPLLLVQEGTGWKLTLKEKYLNLVQNIVPETELPKSVLETLAVIAWKQPVLQSDVIKIRTNKAYDHISELEEAGFISKSKQGRSFIIRATPKFFEYFDVPDKERIKEIFSKVEEKNDVPDLGGLEVVDVKETEPVVQEQKDDIFQEPEPKKEEITEKIPEVVKKEAVKTIEKEEPEPGRKLDPELENILETEKDD